MQSYSVISYVAIRSGRPKEMLTAIGKIPIAIQ